MTRVWDIMSLSIREGYEWGLRIMERSFRIPSRETKATILKESCSLVTLSKYSSSPEMKIMRAFVCI
jgi:hypothetical protein